MLQGVQEEEPTVAKVPKGHFKGLRLSELGQLYPIGQYLQTKLLVLL